ncbi:hemicentin-1-like [Stylophora pistillata]|uniref:hemicentin-1-like n=1 Tax=Stylophora pistillata TaxID=50429 RepID=UPI000C053EBE|nr:hemicentin-1-like [Stylophora pistillata]
MTTSDKSRPSSFLVICCLCTTLLSVVCYSVSFMRMAGELRAQNERILALEENRRKATTDIPLPKPSTPEILDVQPPSSSAQKRNPRAADSPAKGDNGVLSPKFIRQITKSVYAATHKICTSKSQICIKGQKGEPGDWNSISPNSLQPVKGEAGGVVTAPGIQVTPAVSTVGLSETVAFQCSPEKNVVAVISWSKEEGSLPAGRYFIVKGALYIRNTTVGDHGMYVCTIRTDQGTAQASVTLNVKARPLISLPAGPLLAESGKDVKLPQCQVIGYPPPVVSWTKLFGQLPGGRTIVQGHTLTITKADKKDSGTYICTASNAMGTSHSITSLVVNVMPQFTVKPPEKVELYHGQSVTLNCSADGHPVPRITWTRCKGDIPADRSEVGGGQLKINSLTAKDSGTYICSAQSEFVHRETEVQLIVKTARDCAELLSADFKESGVYTINPANKASFEVYCDMKTDGGGWTVFHKRFSGFVDFNKDWDEYKNGFGYVRGEFWLGNEKIHQLTEIPSQLRVEINTTSAGNRYAKYNNFTVTNEATNYTLFVGLYSGNADNRLRPHNGKSFSTKDRDNDESSGHCAQGNGGAWWYYSCSSCYLNSNYGNPYYWTWHYLRGSQMKLKPKSP